MIGSSCEPEGYPSVSSTYLGYFFYDEMSASESAPEMRSIEAHGSLCHGDMRIYVHPTDPLASLQWYQHGVAIAQETDSILDVSYHGSGAGLYACRVSSGDTYVIARYQVDDPNGEVPTVTPFGAGLLCTGNGFYQWYWNGLEVNGATGSYYDPDQNGSYTVVVTSAEGCSATSATYAFLSAGIGASGGQGVFVQHTPDSDVLSVIGATGPFSFTLFDMAGRQLDRTQGNGAHWNYDLTRLPEGVYTVVVNDRAARVVP